MGQLDLIHDTTITNQILSKAPSGSQIKIATGYFNLTDQYIETLIDKTEAQCDILMAHPKVSFFDYSKYIYKLFAIFISNI